MHFFDIPNAALSNESDRPLMQKEVYPLSASLRQYLEQYGHSRPLPVHYPELLHYEYTNAIKDASGKHTHWERVVYKEAYFRQLEPRLLQLFQLLMGDDRIPDKLRVTAIDFCEFANSMPFRIHLQLPGTEPFCFYIKNADASRVAGLILEALLTENTVRFMCHQHTLVETHMGGQPGDECAASLAMLPAEDQQELARAFVRFNENCFTRLLGDMRSYNFVVVHRPGNRQPFHLRAIDFDQQCYEGRLNLYLPQYYKENLGFVELVKQHLTAAETEKLQLKERQHMVALSVRRSRPLYAFLRALEKDELSENYKVIALRKELNHFHNTHRFNLCHSMGSLVKQQLKCQLHSLLPGLKMPAATK
jgi:hypothetical protein